MENFEKKDLQEGGIEKEKVFKVSSTELPEEVILSLRTGAIGGMRGANIKDVPPEIFKVGEDEIGEWEWKIFFNRPAGEDFDTNANLNQMTEEGFEPAGFGHMNAFLESDDFEENFGKYQIFFAHKTKVRVFDRDMIPMLIKREHQMDLVPAEGNECMPMLCVKRK
ncbi:MAG: hypothetical protein RL538_425 [Candidatus Parcubacteria bacterium]|jgi:hypothetical protein